jgi:hypothetical protein
MPYPKQARSVPAGVDAKDPNRILTKDQAEYLTSLNWATIRRNHPDLIIHLSPGRTGIRYADATRLRDLR